MKKLYFLLTSILFVFALHAQQDSNSHALAGTCLNPDDGTVSFVFDLGQNCPEADPNNVLPGISAMGLHSGINDWSTIIGWDAAGATTLMNNGADSFLITLNTMDYWGVAFGDVESIRLIPNDGALNPSEPWGDEGKTMRDSVNGENFGDPTLCSDMIIYMAQTPTCADLAQASSLALFSDAGDSESCVDEADGLVRIDLDYGLACPEGDPDSLLVGVSALALHSGANDWAASVNWDDPNAAQLTNDGTNNFSTIIDVQAYYGLALADIVNIKFVGNNGVQDPDNAWDIALRDPRNGGFGGSEPCSDLVMVIDEAPDCDLTLSTNDLQLQRSLKVTPNPFRNRAFLEFDNPNNETLDLVITDMTGRVVRTMNSLTGERVLIERENLPDGMYFATLSDENGDFATTKLVVK